MDLAQQERHRAATLPEGSVVAVLLEQHARIRDLCDEVGSTTGPARQAAFDDLRELLALHEAGEQIVVRPAAKEAASEQEVVLRDHEEQEEAHALAALEKLDVDGADFAEKFAAFEQDVSDHARREESEEFPYILTRCDLGTQQEMGKRLLSAQPAVATDPRPRPAATGSGLDRPATDPFASLFDRARDRFARDGS